MGDCKVPALERLPLLVGVSVGLWCATGVVAPSFADVGQVSVPVIQVISKGRPYPGGGIPEEATVTAAPTSKAAEITLDAGNSSVQLRLDPGTVLAIPKKGATGPKGKPLLCTVMNCKHLHVSSGPHTVETVAGSKITYEIQVGGRSADPSGTSFSIEHLATGDWQLSVFDGQVELENNRDHQRVQVHAWEYCIGKGDDGPISKPRRMTGIDALDAIEWLFELEKTAPKVEWRLGADGFGSSHPEIASGDEAFNNHRVQEALRHYRTASAGAPETQVRLAAAELEMRHLEAAQQLFNEVLGRLDAPQGVRTEARLGLARLLLAKGNLRGAVKAADEIKKDDRPVQRVQAAVIRGVALLHLPGSLDGATRELEGAASSSMTGDAADLGYEAKSWLAMVYLSRGESGSALRYSQEATRQADQQGVRSALAHSHLSTVHFYRDEFSSAVREARVAQRLDPTLPDVQVALAQALLAQGDTDRAIRTATRALIAEPRSVQLLTILGSAYLRDDQQEAARKVLEAAHKLAPRNLPVAVALAKVRWQLKTTPDADAILKEIRCSDPDAGEVQLLENLLHYWRGEVAEAATNYERAFRSVAGSNPAFQISMIRMLLDANRLAEAIKAGEKAVRSEPKNAQLHALLGLAYDYSHARTLAQREYRTALALDSQNALARVQLGGAQDDAALVLASTIQAFVFEPRVGQQILRGGIRTDLSAEVTDDPNPDARVTQQADALGQRIHTLSALEYNSQISTSGGSSLRGGTYASMAPDGDTRTLLNIGGLLNRTNSVTEDRHDVSEQREVIARGVIRHRLGFGRYLWLSLGGSQNNSSLVHDDLTAGGHSFHSESETAFFAPEFRFDLGLGMHDSGEDRLSIGAGAVPTTSVSGSSNHRTRRSASAVEAYVQYQKQEGRLSLIAQLRQALFQDELDVTIRNSNSLHLQSNRYWRTLPSLLASYQLGERTTIRLIANRQSPAMEPGTRLYTRAGDFLNILRVNFGSTGFALHPVDPLLASEPLNSRSVSPTRERQVEQLDLEQYLTEGQYAKVFLFHFYTNSFQKEFSSQREAEVIGVGSRFERRLGDELYFSVLGTASNVAARQYNNTGTSREVRSSASLRGELTATFSYISRRGFKTSIDLEGTTPYREVRLGVGGDARPASLAGNLVVAHEFSVFDEIYLSVFRLFDTEPGGDRLRTFVFGYSHRFR